MGRIAFEQRPADSINPTFLEIGKKVLEKCRGVPLVIRTIAGKLSFKESENEWLSFKDNELARVIQQEGDILPTLKLSYNYLPSHLKHCFAYCRLYPKDHEICVETLIQLWIAQGFIEHSNSNQSLEDIGFGYFKELVERSFFQEVRGKYLDDYRNMRCKMHDLMHDLAELVAGAGSTILESNPSTSAVTEKFRHISIDFSLITSHEISKEYPFFRAKKLRTLLHIRERFENLSNENCDSIISSFRYLRALELTRLGLSEVPTSTHKLKHLRYLDLSYNTALKILPISICKIQNLQVLKLDSCSGLKKLPENIEKLVNLTHLGLQFCRSLTHMPRGIGKLTSLRTLSWFAVDQHGTRGGDISELSGLNNLRGELTITNLGYMKDAKKKFQAANLKEKAHLQSLGLKWSADKDDDEKSLEDLQPHSSLKKLSLYRWMGVAKFPNWFSLLSNLTDITIIGPSKFKHLPAFHQLRHLDVLWISGLSELEYMDHNLASEGGQAELFFPSLTFLVIFDCPNLKSWWRNINDDDETIIRTFPRLSYLSIGDCPLTSMPLYPSVQQGLALTNCSSGPLLQTMQAKSIPSSLPLSKLKSFELVNVEGLDVHLLDACLQNLTCLESLGISTLSRSLQNLTGLKSLTIEDSDDEELDFDGAQWEALRNLSSLKIQNCTRLVPLPSWLQHLIGPKDLLIENYDRLTSLFSVFPHLTSLQRLEICGCKGLELSAPDTQVFQGFKSLRFLELRSIPKCRQLNLIQHLTNLQSLHLCNLPNLTSLPDEMQSLTNLEVLVVEKIPQLSEGCRKDIGVDWPKIVHIPYIRIDGTQVQKISKTEA